MKHLLNDLSDEEKNGIREQHSGGKKIVIENFNKLINTKLGDAKPYLNEEEMGEKSPNIIDSTNGKDLIYDLAPISLRDIRVKSGYTYEILKKLVEKIELEVSENKRRYEPIVVDVTPKKTGKKIGVGYMASIKNSTLILEPITD